MQSSIIIRILDYIALCLFPFVCSLVCTGHYLWILIISLSCSRSTLSSLSLGDQSRWQYNCYYVDCYWYMGHTIFNSFILYNKSYIIRGGVVSILFIHLLCVLQNNVKYHPKTLVDMSPSEPTIHLCYKTHVDMGHMHV